MAKELERPTTATGLEAAAKLLQSGKSLRPDVFAAEFYKTFSKWLAPQLLEMFTETFNSGNSPKP